MARYRVINRYRACETGTLIEPGTIVRLSLATGAAMVARRLVVPLARQAPVETATRGPSERAVARDGPRHLGGGWYEVNGERVRGREAAHRRFQEQS